MFKWVGFYNMKSGYTLIQTTSDNKLQQKPGYKTKTQINWGLSTVCCHCYRMEMCFSIWGVAALWLIHLSLDQTVRFRALAGDIALWRGVLGQDTLLFTLTVPFSTQVGTGKLNARGKPCYETASYPGESRNTTETIISSGLMGFLINLL